MSMPCKDSDRVSDYSALTVVYVLVYSVYSVWRFYDLAAIYETEDGNIIQGFLASL